MSLPEWLDPLPDAAEQRALDEWAINERGIPGLELMERAGTGLADLVGSLVPDGRVVVVCGKGNNGGDGLVTARVLRERGREVEVLLLGDPGEFRGDAATNLERLPGAGAGRVRGVAARRRGGDRRRRPRHRLLRGAARARGRRDRGDQRCRREVQARA